MKAYNAYQNDQMINKLVLNCTPAERRVFHGRVNEEHTKLRLLHERQRQQAAAQNEAESTGENKDEGNY